MAVTMEDVRAALEPEEPDYPKAARKLGAAALRHLERLITGDHAMLASKATYLASLLQADGVAAVIAKAARSSAPAVRVAAAAAAGNLAHDAASKVLLALVDDGDAGVRKVAFKSVPAGASDALRSRMQALSASEKDPALKKLSAAAVKRVKK